VALIAFFAVGALYVFGCNRIIGSDEKALAEEEGRAVSADGEPAQNGRAG
jgi:hypothetical protein